MPKNDTFYHEQAIKYNTELIEFALALAERLEHPEIQRWARAVAKQHRVHLGRHERSLQRLKNEEASMSESEKTTTDAEQNEGIVLTTYDGETAENFEQAVEEQQKADVDYRDAGTGQFVTEEYAHDNPTTTVSETRDMDAQPIEEVGPDPELAAEPVEAGVGTAPTLTEEEAQAAFEKAQREAEEAAKNA